MYTDRVSSADVWSYPNLHGDVMAVADGAGAKQRTTLTYDPFGQPLVAGAPPDNSAGNLDYGWLGQHQRPTETEAGIHTIEMGARPYVPGLGRFLAIDPIEGGSANDYDYVCAVIHATTSTSTARDVADDPGGALRQGWRPVPGLHDAATASVREDQLTSRHPVVRCSAVEHHHDQRLRQRHARLLRRRRTQGVRAHGQARRPMTHRAAAAGGILAVPLASTVVVAMSDELTGLVAVAGLVVLLGGGVAFEILAGLGARRRGLRPFGAIVGVTTRYYVGASVLLVIAWFVGLRGTTMRGFDVSASVGLGALGSLWIAAAITAAVVSLVVTMSAALSSRRRPRSG